MKPYSYASFSTKFPEEMMYCDEIAGIEPWQDHVILTQTGQPAHELLFSYDKLVNTCL